MRWHGTFTAPSNSLDLGEAVLELPDGREAGITIKRFEGGFGLFVGIGPLPIPRRGPSKVPGRTIGLNDAVFAAHGRTTSPFTTCAAAWEIVGGPEVLW